MKHNPFWWVDKSAMEIVWTQLNAEDSVMICEESIFLSALEKVLRRPVNKDELTRFDELSEEMNRKYPAKIANARELSHIDSKLKGEE